jgi:hypothetical protein
VLTNKKEPPWSIKKAVGKASFPYSSSNIGNPRKEVFPSPETKIKQPVVRLSHPNLVPRKAKKAQDSRKVNHAEEGARSKSHLSCSGGMCKRASAGSAR